jgi:hypothetical protein
MLTGDHLLISDLGAYLIIFVNLCVLIVFAMVMLLRGFGLHIFYFYGGR